MEGRSRMGEAEERLARHGLRLPPAPRPVGSYLPARAAGRLVFVSGQLPLVEGELPWRGKVGGEVSPEEAEEAARAAALNALAALADAAGGLERVGRAIRLGVYVASAPGFTDQVRVANAASEILVKALGEEGKHARVAVGVAELPRNAPVEVELTAELLEEPA